MQDQDRLRRDERDVPHWDLECDVLIVGYGCAGACAAIEAAEAGAEVVVLERAGGAGSGPLASTTTPRTCSNT